MGSLRGRPLGAKTVVEWLMRAPLGSAAAISRNRVDKDRFIVHLRVRVRIGCGTPDFWGRPWVGQRKSSPSACAGSACLTLMVSKMGWGSERSRKTLPRCCGPLEQPRTPTGKRVRTASGPARSNSRSAPRHSTESARSATAGPLVARALSSSSIPPAPGGGPDLAGPPPFVTPRAPGLKGGSRAPATPATFPAGERARRRPRP